MNLFELYDREGYTLIRGMEEYANQSGEAAKIIFIQQEGSDQGSLPYAIDRKEGDLTLAQITENAIQFLTRNNDNGFFLMVEGGKIDWACHGNDAATVFTEVVDMSEAVQRHWIFIISIRMKR